MEPLKSTGAQAAKMQAREETTSLRNPSHPPRDGDLVAQFAPRIDALLKLAEENGWNAAINECRRRLPPEYSQRLRDLYRQPAETPISSADGGSR